MIRVAMVSFWHVHANDYACQAEEHPDTEIAAVWDEIPERGRKEAEVRGVPFYESLGELLKQDGIDAVIVDAPTHMHREVMVKAAAAGKHIFTEKVLAATLHEANEIVDAAKKAGIVLTVSLPRLNDGYTETIQQVLAEGLLGKLTLVRVRLSHNGAFAGWLPEHFFNAEQCQGGALIDLGCHPMYLTRLFLGEPDRISAHYGYVTGKDVEDNAVAVLQYDNGALGLVEAGFVNSCSPFTIELQGTDGTLLYGTPESRVLVRSSRLESQGGSGWVERNLPASRPSAFHQWVSHIQQGTTADANIHMALELTRMMEAANQSVRHSRPFRLDELQP
ncbi:Gfo/Idh/MocA family protein [Paenibacillus popilliae]|uniref:Predicted dehydrogenase n=1 Tax=Paenibacillus popilliae ATCC 14706 TaxID=1212764 RepID=M9M753_PAEPP|nr:Gfo/Idh/MocA family oxidoreductase [Paenibacillus popilliae]GAC43488.1 predicted dehydrogenase [Paenibacillus popilliae ATCC 14706]